MEKFIISSLTVNQIKLSASSEIDNIIQEGEVIFKKKTAVSLPEVSKLIDRETRRPKETQFP